MTYEREGAAPEVEGPQVQDPGPAQGPLLPGLLAAPGVADRAQVLARLQRSAGNAAVNRVLAREPVAEKTSVKFGAGELTTYGELAQALKFLALQVRDDIKGLDPESDAVKRALETAKGMEGWAAFLEKSPSQPLGGIVIGQAEGHMADARKARGDIQYIKDAPARELLRKLREEAEAIEKQLEKMQPTLKEAARSAFKADKENELVSLLNLVSGILDNGLAVDELGRQVTQFISKSALNVDIAAAGKYVEGLQKLNKGLAVLNVAITLTGDKATTEFEEGLRWVSISANLFSSLGTIAGLAPHIGLYANLYLVPLTDAIIKSLGKLAEMLHKANSDWVAFQGKPLYMDVEQGGAPMWGYMKAVMLADKPAEVPKEPPKSVQEFFVDHRDRFEAGLKSKVPVSGYVFKDLDLEPFRPWVHRHRDRIWILLYGAHETPRK